MPGIQVLPQNPSFGSQLGQALGSGVSQGISQQLQSHYEQKQKQQQLSALLSALGIGPQEQTMTQQAMGMPSVPQGQGQRPPEQKGINLSPESALAGAIVNPSLAPILGTMLQGQEQRNFKREEAERARSEKLLEPHLQAQTAIPGRKLNLRVARQSIEEGVGPLSGSNLAEITGRKEFTEASGAALNSAMKNYLVDTLGSVSGGGAKPNMYIEQQINKGFPQIGQKKTANLASLEIAEANLKMEEEFLNRLQNKVEQYESRGQIPGRQAVQEAQKEMIPVAEKIQRDTALKIRELQEQEMSKSDLSPTRKVVAGTPLTDKMADILFQKYKTSDKVREMALKLGYDIGE